MKQKNLKGIGGWLILPTITLFVNIGLGLYNVVAGMQYETDIGMLYVFYGIALTIFAVYCLNLEFKLKKEFPSMMIKFLWINLIAIVILSAAEQDYTSAGRSLIGAVIWINYFTKSVRVKNTFVK